MSELETRPAGGGVLQATVVGIGCNNFGRRLDAGATARVVLTALEEGITFFDTADTYGNGQSEEMLGAALKGRREEAVIATKFGHPSGGEGHSGASRRWIRIAVEGSLRRLGTDWIDLYQMHMPDPATLIDETLETLTELVSEGKVRCVGSSNLAGWQIADADWMSRTRGLTRFISVQNEYSLLNRSVEEEVIPACAHFDVGMIPYSPLGSGVLSGNIAVDRERPLARALPLRPAPPRAGSATVTSISSKLSRRSPLSAVSPCSTSRSAVSRHSRRCSR